MAIATRTGTAIADIATVNVTALADIETIDGIEVGGGGGEILNWPMTNVGGGTITATAGPNGSTNGTLAAGLLVLNGINQQAHSVAAVSYAGADQITVSITFTLVSNAGTQVIVESSANWFANNFAWVFLVDATQYQFGIKQGGNFTFYTIAAPTAGVSRVAKIYYDASVAGGLVRFFLSGVEQVLTPVSNGISPGSFIDYPLNLGARDGGGSPSLFAGLTTDFLIIEPGLV